MSRALLARSLAEDEGDVLMVDWDLEAPGLHRYFGSFCRFGLGDPPDRDRALDERLGLLDFFEELKSNIAERDEGTDRVDEDATRKLIEQVGCDRFVIRTDIPRLHLMKAGRFDATYASRIGKFNWEQLHTLAPTLFRSVSEFLAERYQYVLIDSRTGLTDTSGICTMLMPERLVVVFTPNRQSLTGVLELVRNATKYRRQSSDLRPLIVYPLPSRVELSEEALRHTWRLGDASNGIVGYQALFESMLADVYGLTECDLGDYFDDIQIQHVPRYAFGEEIAALIEPRVDSLSLTRSYARFAQRIQTSSRAWDTAPSSAAAPAGPGVTVAEPPAMPPAPAARRVGNWPLVATVVSLIAVVIASVGLVASGQRVSEPGSQPVRPTGVPTAVLALPTEPELRPLPTLASTSVPTRQSVPTPQPTPALGVPTPQPTPVMGKPTPLPTPPANPPTPVPIPRMLDVNLPKTALPGERIQFTVRATNLLEPATSGSISVSFPDNVAVTIADSSPAASGGSFAQVFRSGATIFSFSMNRAIPAQYPLAELYLSEAWQLEEERHLTLMVRTPEDRDSLTIQVRMTLRNAAGLFNFPANGPTDQQGFTIQKYLLPVAR